MKFGLHDYFYNTFCPCLFTREFIDGFDHLSIRFPFVFQGFGFSIGKVVFKSNSINRLIPGSPRLSLVWSLVPGPI